MAKDTKGELPKTYEPVQAENETSPSFDLTDQRIPQVERFERLVEFFKDSAKAAIEWPKLDAEDASKLRRSMRSAGRYAQLLKSSIENLGDRSGNKDEVLYNVCLLASHVYAIGQHANVTESSRKYFQSKQARDSGKKGHEARDANRSARRKYVIQKRTEILEKNPALSQDDLIKKIRDGWKHFTAVPSARTIQRYFDLDT